MLSLNSCVTFALEAEQLWGQSRLLSGTSTALHGSENTSSLEVVGGKEMVVSLKGWGAGTRVVSVPCIFLRQTLSHHVSFSVHTWETL